MLDKKEFKAMRRWFKDFEKERNQVMDISRKIISYSKRAISLTMRNKFKPAEKLVEDMYQLLKQLPKKNLNTNLPTVAVQEYVEAACFFYFVKEKRLPTLKELKVDIDAYLLGLSDLSGELVRLAVNDVINGNYDRPLEIKDFVSELYTEFLQFELRDSELRKKSDAIRWNLRKLEDLALDIKLKSN